MANENKNQSNKKESTQSKGKADLKGAPTKSNRQTGGSDRNQRDHSNDGPDKNTTKKGANSV